ncbi:MAG: phosphotransferase [Caldilineaceae bacterium]|nr:phosphotransferase [Caldilineaceae bacterium]
MSPHIESIDQSQLNSAVRQVLADDSAMVRNWTHQPLHGGFSGAAVHRIAGQAQTSAGNRPWSLILKIISPAHGGQAATDYDYWQRESLLYQSGLLADLPDDLLTPRCFAITPQSDQSQWLWLEDMGAEMQDEWALTQYGVAARHLGQMNGAYLVNRPLPRQPWLRQPDVHERLALAAPGISELPSLTHSLFAELLTGNRIQRIRRLWDKREHLLAALAELPLTFCHRDAFRRNLMARRNAEGRAQTVALDWGAAGLGQLGEELIPLFAATLSFVAIDVARIPQLDQLIFDGYIAGLRDAGWRGDARLVRFGFTALAALKVGVAEPAIKLPNVARRVAALPPDAEPPRLLSPGGPQQAAALGHYLLKLGDEACNLIS